MGGRRLTIEDETLLAGERAIGAEEYPVFHDLRKEGHSMTAMNYMLEKGKYALKGLIMTAANPAVTNPNTAKVEKALSSLDLFVVNDFFVTKTARLADYILPAATFLEREEIHYFNKRQLVNLSRRVITVDGVRDDYALWHDLAHRLGLRVIGEGVETRSQLDVLRALDCDEIQGFYFSKPVKAGEIDRLLEKSFH